MCLLELCRCGSKATFPPTPTGGAKRQNALAYSRQNVNFLKQFLISVTIHNESRDHVLGANHAGKPLSTKIGEKSRTKDGFHCRFLLPKIVPVEKFV